MIGIKKIFVLLVAMLATTAARADGLVACIYYNGDLQEKVLLSHKPVLKMDGTNISMQLGGEQYLEIPAIGVVVNFEAAGGDVTSIHSVSDSHSVPAYKISEDNVSISGLTPGEMVRIYSIGGQLVSAARVDDKGCASMPIGKGVMVLSTGNRSLKVINK